MFLKIFKSPFAAFKFQIGGAFSSLQERRSQLLDGVLRGVFILSLVALVSAINNVMVEYKESREVLENPETLAFLTISIYLATSVIFAFITFNRKLSFNLRAGLLLFNLYALGTTGMILTSFSGDGRILLFTFVVFSGMFYDLRYSLTAFLISLLTLGVIGYLQVSGILYVPPKWQVNAALPGAWISGGLVMIFLSIAVLISINYLLQALEGSLAESRKTLQREHRLSQILRTVSEVNRLIVRAQDQKSLLMDACTLLIADRDNAFAWVGLLKRDGTSLEFTACAGDLEVGNKFKTRLGREIQPPVCVESAIHSKAYYYINPTDGDDPCQTCPRRAKYPNHPAVALPLLHNDRVLGCLVVDYDGTSEKFDDQEISLLQELANNLAYALENIEASKQLNMYASFQKLLNNVTRSALNAFDLDSLLQDFIRKLEEVMDADGYYFALWGEARQFPSKFVSSEIFKDIPILMPTSRLFSQSILDAGRILAVPDVMDSPYISPLLTEKFHIRSALGIPLIANNQQLGVLVFGYREMRSFNSDELELAEQASQQFALAILKVKLNDETRLKAAELEQLYSSAQDMASSLLDPPALLEKLARHMTEALNATSTYITSIDMEAETMRVVAEYWSNEAAPAETQSDLGRIYLNRDYATVLRSMLAGQVIVLQENDLEMTPIERGQFSKYQVKSMLFAPIMAHGKMLGTVEIWESRRRREFTEVEKKLALAMAGYAASIIENAELVNALRASEARYRTLVEQASDGIFLATPERQFVDVNPSGCAMLGYSRAEILSMHIEDLIFPDELSKKPLKMAELLDGKTVIVEHNLKRKDGSPIPVEISAKILPNGYLQGIVRDISERRQAEKTLADREVYYRALIENSAEGVAILDAEGKILYIAPSEERLTGFTVDEILGGSAFKYIHPDDVPEVLRVFSEGAAVPGAVRTVEHRLQRKGGEWRHFEVTGHNMLHEPHIAGIIINYRDVTERKLAEQALGENEARLEGVIRSAFNAIITTDENQRIVLFNPAAEKVFGLSAAKVLGQSLDVIIPKRYRNNHHSHVQHFSKTGTSSRSKGTMDSLYGLRANGEEFPMEAYISQSHVNGHKFFTVILQDITERKKSEETLRQRAYELEILANVSSSLRAASNVAEMTPLITYHAAKVVNAANGSIFLLDDESGDLVSSGWYDSDRQRGVETALRHRIGEGVTGLVAQSGKPYFTVDLQTSQVAIILPLEADRMHEIHSGLSLPLRARNQVIGVLHIWLHEKRSFTENETRLLTAIAEMAGNAIHRASLHEQTLEHANELALAYDNTLAGWARALELRDELTEGHTRRVTELTLELARAMNVPESDLVQIRRGAILHDIGKMGIPDSILNKPGPLTAHEQRIMHMHPQYAYEMLSFIPFLQPALDIPYCHHEWWNGKGYPRGLKGEEIPLSARIFTVVDVWDALTSDRPYRPAWSPDITLKYIQDGSGKQFDPIIVDMFLKLIEKR